MGARGLGALGEPTLRAPDCCPFKADNICCYKQASITKELPLRSGAQVSIFQHGQRFHSENVFIQPSKKHSKGNKSLPFKMLFTTAVNHKTFRKVSRTKDNIVPPSSLDLEVAPYKVPASVTQRLLKIIKEGPSFYKVLNYWKVVDFFLFFRGGGQ